ncbi:acyl-CoA dehydrogenase/oxidase [Annulohypoxylon truncatum]|uniref:acyl-CoA dehydrogenase/oxidase n=1 Tax=Annulohypoxylon truncatum TaxID=327061 RepID=UPI0020089B96|nr:acyl-CoA dehydrogenase/oxidase [Annulohypoxylon truncatum]KAI1207694.1 acyl-CoA dehydrogenase/oxidase [Annulohypoxylon truncatum]
MARASSSSDGFFQPFPVLEPQYTSEKLLNYKSSKSSQQLSDDPVLARILRLYLPPEAQNEVGASIHKLSRRVLEPSVLWHSVEAETNVPTLHPLTTFGKENKTDSLHTCEGWKALKAIGVEEGAVSTAYDKNKPNYNRRVAQFGIGHVWGHTAAMTMCPMSMTDGAAALLSRHLNDPDGDQPGRQAVLNETYRRLVSQDPKQSWTSGQWMTERTGGSDVSGTETVARRLTRDEVTNEERLGHNQDSLGQPLGPWSIDGFKWFSSATDSDVVVLLARTCLGISAFLVPMRRKAHSRLSDSNSTELNGIRIQRLKDKLGTKGLPTAEVELKGARGWLIGQEGKGVKEVSAILNITRVYSAAGSISYWSRGLAVCRAFSKVRKARGRFLYDHPRHVLWMADETVKYWAATHFTFFAVALLGCSTQGWETTAKNTSSETLIPQDPAHQAALLRLLTPVVKARVPVASVSGLRETMECLGGVGYCENNEDGGTMNLAKLFRDCIANTIWEGTASVMAEDVCRVIKDKRIAGGNVIEAVFCRWALGVLQHCRGSFKVECEVIEKKLQALVALVQGASPEELEYRSRHLLSYLETISSAIILLYDASTDGDEIASHIASRYVGFQAVTNNISQREYPGRSDDATLDHKIFLGASFRPKGIEGKL